MTLSSAQRQTLSWTAIAFAAFGLLWLLAPVLAPFLVGAVLAYALHPAVEWLVARHVPRWLAVSLMVLFALFLSFALLLLIVPVVTKEIPLLRQQLPVLLDRLDKSVAPWLAQFGINVALDTQSLKAYTLKFMDANLEDGVAAALNSFRVGGTLLIAVVGMIVLVPVVLAYLLMDWAKLVSLAHAMIPPRMRPAVDGFLDECDGVLGQYLRGQLLVMLILAAYYACGLAVAGFDLAVPVGLFTGLAVCIPYIGFGLGLMLALLAGVLQFSSGYALIAVALVYGVGQIVEGFFLTPRLVGERIGLHPLVVIFALLAFGKLFGFVGVLVALPVSALGLVAVRRVRAAYFGSRLFLGG